MAGLWERGEVVLRSAEALFSNVFYFEIGKGQWECKGGAGITLSTASKISNIIFNKMSKLELPAGHKM